MFKQFAPTTYIKKLFNGNSTGNNGNTPALSSINGNDSAQPAESIDGTVSRILMIDTPKIANAKEDIEDRLWRDKKPYHQIDLVSTLEDAEERIETKQTDYAEIIVSPDYIPPEELKEFLEKIRTGDAFKPVVLYPTCIIPNKEMREMIAKTKDPKLKDPSDDAIIEFVYKLKIGTDYDIATQKLPLDYPLHQNIANAITEAIANNARKPEFQPRQ